MRESSTKKRKRAYVQNLKAQKNLPSKDFSAERLKKLEKELVAFRSSVTSTTQEIELHVYVVADIDRVLDTIGMLKE